MKTSHPIADHPKNIFLTHANPLDMNILEAIGDNESYRHFAKSKRIESLISFGNVACKGILLACSLVLMIEYLPNHAITGGFIFFVAIALSIAIAHTQVLRYRSGKWKVSVNGYARENRAQLFQIGEDFSAFIHNKELPIEGIHIETEDTNTNVKRSQIRLTVHYEKYETAPTENQVKQLQINLELDNDNVEIMQISDYEIILDQA